jgi:hypothetical protein
MATASQRKASATHRRRAAARGIVRVEVQATKGDVGLIKAVADILRDKTDRARALRATLESALADPQGMTAFEVFGSDLPDSVFEGVFDELRLPRWREIDL